MQQKQILEDSGFLIITNHLPLQFVKNSWLKRLSLHLCPRNVFPSNFFFNELLFRLMENTKQLYVLPTIVECHFAITSFDLWMSKVGHDIFTLVINFLGNDW